MRGLSQIRFYVRSLLSKRKLDEQLSAEVRTHVEMATEANVANGMTPEEARYAALREFGNVAQVQERTREEHGWVWLEQIRQDGRYGLRQLGRTPGFTVVVVLTLALGIGATTAIFSVVNAVILHPIGGPAADRLIQVVQREVVQDREFLQGVGPVIRDAVLGDSNHFSAVGWSEWASFERRTEDFIQNEIGMYVSPNFFPLLDATPILGRGFLAGEEVPIVDALPSRDAPIVLSHGWWQTAWAGDQNILGRVIEMGGRHFTVIGVMPSHFRFPHPDTKFWVPAQPILPPAGGARVSVTRMVARLRPGTTLDEVQAWLDVLARRLMKEHPASDPYGDMWRLNPKGLQVFVRPLSVALHDFGNWNELRATFFGLLVAIGFVLLIVCANVANLALARLERRQHEFAVRAATGATRGRLMRQLLTENLLLTALGGGAGLLVTVWMVKVLVAMNGMPRLRAVEIDSSLLGIAFAVSMVTALAFGLVPMWRAGNVPVNALLADGGVGGTAGRRRSRLSDLLVVGQVAIAVVLLTGAGLMLCSVNRLLRVKPGFNPANLLFVDVYLPWRKYANFQNETESTKLKDLLLARLGESMSALPGVKAVGFHQFDAIFAFQVIGREGPFYALHGQVSAGLGGLFAAIGAPIMEGRTFKREEATRTEFVVVNEALARKAWPGETAVGRKLRLGEELLEVIGVVADARTEGLVQEVSPIVYHPYESMWSGRRIIGGAPPQLVIRTERNPEDLVSAVRRELKAAEPALTMPRFRVARDILFDSTAARRTYRNYLGLFATVGLLLSALGVYGVLAYSVARRTREIGIRLAIGAESTQVHFMILRQGGRLVLLGLISGLIAAGALTRFLQSQLYEVSPTDPTVMGAVLAVIFAVAMLACWLPARRAARVDPVVALRTE